MGSYSSHNGTLTIDRVALAKSAATLQAEWTTLHIYEDCPTTGEPHEVVLAALDGVFGSDFGDGLELIPADENEPFTTFEVSTHAKDNDGQDKVIAVLAESGAVGTIQTHDDMNYHSLTRLDGATVASVSGTIVFPDDIEYAPPLSARQREALTAAHTILLASAAAPADLRAALTDLVIALRNAPLIDEDAPDARR